MKRTVNVEIRLTTDEPSETLLDPALWMKAVGIFKADVTVHSVMSDEFLHDAPKKTAKKAGLKKRTAPKKVTTKKKKP